MLQWLILFSTACFGNLLGLNISAGMRSAVSIYILIPLLLVPNLILGGAMIRFDDLHHSITKKKYVPVIADLMVTRWAFEALSVEQFRSRKILKPFFEYDMAISQNNWYASFLIPALRVKSNECLAAGKDPEYSDYSKENFSKLSFHINELSSITGIKPGSWFSSLNYDDYNDFIASETILLLDSMRTSLRNTNKFISNSRDSVYRKISEKIGEQEFIKQREQNYNENLGNILLNRMITDKIFDSEDRLIQKADPIYMKPGSKWGRAHFYAPYKQIGSIKIGTLVFNMIIIWLMIFFLFVTLYYNILKKFVDFLESLNLPILKKFGRGLIPK